MATIAATAFGAGSLVASIMGMNLQTALFEQDHWVFDVMVGGIAVGVLVLLVGMLSCLNESGRQGGAQAGAAAGGGCAGCLGRVSRGVTRGSGEQRSLELPRHRLVGI